MKTRDSAVHALDEFFRIVRDKAQTDAAFASELVQALNIPIRIEQEAKPLSKTLPYYDPFVLAGQGFDEFRRVFRPMTDANLRKVITHFNIASKDEVSASSGKKGEALFEILWVGAERERQRMLALKPL